MRSNVFSSRIRVYCQCVHHVTAEGEDLKCLFPSTGYVLITNIPSGASDIQVIERHKTENILGERFSSSEFHSSQSMTSDR